MLQSYFKALISTNMLVLDYRVYMAFRFLNPSVTSTDKGPFKCHTHNTMGWGCTDKHYEGVMRWGGLYNFWGKSVT